MAILSDDASRILSAAAVLQKKGARFRFVETPQDLKQIVCACCDNIEVALVEEPLPRAHIQNLLRQPLPAAICPALHTVVLMEEADTEMREQVRQAGATLVDEAPQDSLPLQDLLHTRVPHPSPVPASPRAEPSEFGLLLSGVFEIRSLEEAEKLSNLLASNTPEPEKVRIGIWELLSNAIEHGNLGISFEEKTRLLETGRFHEEVTRRLRLKRYRDRVARVVFSAGPNSARLQVSDEGPGFDFRKFLKRELQLERPNGRGIRLVCRMCFDELSYIGAGNTVEATVHFCDRPGDAPEDVSAEENTDPR
ncbi:ATP-binding protein [Breoghania corrubedonensis]|uniref:ATP-binding protein n=1 Tax=Breoghania corrubedonensis TaxID=665038 RepID=UPI001476109B|nr:ATP-binding protein [Breoghania corrubedonensis]